MDLYGPGIISTKKSQLEEVPVIEGFNGDDEKWGKVHHYDYNINTVLQEIAENDVDQSTLSKSPWIS